MPVVPAPFYGPVEKKAKVHPPVVRGPPLGEKEYREAKMALLREIAETMRRIGEKLGTITL